jgi:hypothetical protein
MCQKLRSRIDKWRTTQKSLMEKIGDHVASQTLEGSTLDAPEEEKLFLPSDFNSSQRVGFGIAHLAEIERRLQEGTAFDALQTLRTIVKVIVVLRAQKKKNEVGQTQHTRALTKIEDVEACRDLAMADYNESRTRLIMLGLAENDPVFLPLNLTDTYRKPTHLRRAVGDSQRPDGTLWTMTGISLGSRAPAVAPGPSGPALATQPPHQIGTQGSKRKPRSFSPLIFASSHRITRCWFTQEEREEAQ